MKRASSPVFLNGVLAVDGDWFEEDGRVVLVGGRCGRCGKVFFPRRMVCDRCGKEGGQEAVRLSGIGRLYSFSEVHVGRRGLQVPYVIAYLDLPEGVRLFGQVEHRAAELKLDEVLEVTLGVIGSTPEQGNVISYKFRKPKANNA